MSAGPRAGLAALLPVAGQWLRRLARLAAHPLLRLTFLAGALVFLGAVLRGQWGELRSFEFHLRPWPLLGSYVLLSSAWLLELALWRRLLRSLGGDLAPRRAAGVWFASNLVRYLPGNVWQFLGMMELGALAGVRRAAVLLSVAAHQVFSNLAGLCLGAYAIARLLGVRGAVWLSPALALTTALLLFSPWAMPHLWRLLRRWSGADQALAGLARRDAPVIYLGYCLYWLLAGAGFWLMSTAVLASAAGSPLTWVSAFAAAYVAGYLSLLTPSGLGVREGVLALLIAPLVVAAPAAIPALAARVWMTLGELALASAALAADRRFLLGAGKR